jgi:hypothetical protein
MSFYRNIALSFYRNIACLNRSSDEGLKLSIYLLVKLNGTKATLVTYTLPINNCEHNQLTYCSSLHQDVPFQSYNALRELDVSKNLLKSLPNWISQLSRLRILRADGNPLVELDDSIR